MSNLYGVREGERCPGCGYRRNEYPHFRTCVPRQKWPEDMQAPRKKRVVINGLVYDEDKVPAHLMAVSGEASAPGSPDLPDVVDAGSASSPETAPDNQTIYLDIEDGITLEIAPPTVRVEGVDVYSARRCECGYVVPADSKNPGAAMRMHRAKSKAHKET